MRPGPGALLLAVCAVAGCAIERGAVYDLPVDEARRLLRSTDLPPLVFGSEVPALEIRSDSPTRVVWILRRHGSELMRFVAELSPDGERSTRVELGLDAPTAGRFGNVRQRLDDNATLRRLYWQAMAERIASTLERRPYDVTRLYPAMAAATAANIGSITAQAERAAEADRRRARDNIEKAYRDEAAGIDY